MCNVIICCPSDCNGTRTHNHLVRKRTLHHLAKLAKWLSFVVLWVHSETRTWHDKEIQSICCPIRDVKNFEINHSFLIKLILYITKMSEKNVNISRTKRKKQKAFFINFKGLSIVRNCLRSESGPLILAKLKFSIRVNNHWKLYMLKIH